MRRAIALALRGRPTAAPNPPVGAVVVKQGRIVGEGYHRRPGEPHAEGLALHQAGPRGKGATLYVTLEPCSRWGRTEACTEAILQSGVRTVCIGATDPHPDSRGRGVETLRRKVRVISGVLRKECEDLISDFSMRVRRNRPYVILKLAATLDGKIATHTGDSKWITSPAARRWAHRLRAECDAVLVGHGTVERDNPLLLPREVPVKRLPLRVVIDTYLRAPLTSKIFNSGPPGSTLLATSVTAPDRHQPYLERGVVVLVIPKRGDLVDMNVLLQKLAKMGVGRLLIEGGSLVAGTAVDLGAVDEVRFFFAPKIIGGRNSIPMISGRGVHKIAEALCV
ncbi:MAG: bifunctional diaminohydroxyphosphoribosylaminopyrimidine deaminase/5-amino-6-(5-phosphoribosylamino)uracil reductase RibD, partial [Armatimonadetes bacterium]|nr:bifunctional diaminohydroxyphosphoribosylaminopyrimidine deaminase/5-amino-6-(5-phosphoribosylamino)uracil reductase RibD [Armatimonadota bacterium]